MSLPNSELLEHHIESRLVREVKKLNGIPYKFVSPQRRSVPDRLCVFRHNVIYFIEVKRPGGKPTTNQKRELKNLERLNCNTAIVTTYDEIDKLINEIKKKLEFLDEIFSTTT